MNTQRDTAPPGPTVTTEEARHVLHFFGVAGGIEPGSFTAALLSAISKADSSNRAKLSQAFPGYVRAMSAAQNFSGGIEGLQAVAREGTK